MGRRFWLLILLAVAGVMLSACGSGTAVGQGGDGGSSNAPPTEAATEETGLDPSQFDYVLLVEYSFGDEEVVLDQGTMLFRGPISVSPDGKLSVQGEGELEGEFRCPNKDIDSEQEFLGPGQYSGKFPFTASGEVLTPEEAAGDDDVPLVDLTTGEEAKYVVLRLTFPEMNSEPGVQMEGLDTGQCLRGWQEPKGPLFTLGISGMLRGDSGEAFNQLVDLVLSERTAARYLDTLNPDVIKTAVLCLARPGAGCDL